MKSIILFLFVTLGFSQISVASAICGKTAGFSYNKDSKKRPYQLSGFWIKQNTKDIRVTYGNSPELVQFVGKLKGNIFVCLDKYKLVEKKYSGKKRIYAKVKKFRVWVNGKPAKGKSTEDEILFNTTKKRSVLDLQTDPNLKVWERSTLLKDLCYKNATAKEAYKKILKFEEEELLFDFDLETHVKSFVEGKEIVIFALNGKMMDDGLSEREATLKYTIEICDF